MLLDLEGLDNVEDAEPFRGAEVYIRRDDLDRDEEGAYYWFELVGLEVYLDDGRHLGTLNGILPTGGNDVYVVRTGQREILIPATREVIEEIDLDCGRITVREMEGLLDLNEV